MNWMSMSKSLARRRFDELTSSKACASSTDLSVDYREIRDELEKRIPYFKGWDRSTIAYDLHVGFSLREVLEQRGFSHRTASDDGFWRYLSIAVIPEIVKSRWPEMPAKRFWESRSRIWLRVMWWFVHLSWQGSESSTRSALVGLTTDDVVQLVERPGRGFRVELCRNLVRAASVRPANARHFRKLMKLNTARVLTVEPLFFDGGTEAYVSSLYSNLSK